MIDFGKLALCIIFSSLIFPSYLLVSYADQLPNMPIGFTATDVSPTQIDLSWTAGNPGSSPITGYKIEREINGGVWTTIVANLNPLLNKFSDSGLVPLTNYGYRISAINAVGTGPFVMASTRTLIPGPPPPTGLTATTVSPTQIDLSWKSNNPIDFPITGYKIMQLPGYSTQWNTIVLNTGNSGTVYHSTGLIPNTHYYYAVAAYNIGGIGSPSVVDATTAIISKSINPIIPSTSTLHVSPNSGKPQTLANIAPPSYSIKPFTPITPTPAVQSFYIHDQKSCESLPSSNHVWSIASKTCSITNLSLTLKVGDDLTVASGVVLEIFSGSITNSGLITLENGGSIISHIIIVNFGHIDNYGTISNKMIIRNNIGGKIDNNIHGIINNFQGSTIYNVGTISNNSGGNIRNFGTIFNYYIISNNSGGTITNFNIIANSCDANIAGPVTGTQPSLIASCAHYH